MEPTIALLGPPGSGKGTQAARLEDELGYTALSTGQLLRQARADGTELGEQAAGYMDRGELVPDDLVVDALCDRMEELEGAILLDGFPRTVSQAEALEARGRKLGAALLIDVPDAVVVERMSGRGREDDGPETVRERLRVYHRDTEPLVAYYGERGLLRRVDGSGDPDAVHERLREALAG